MARPAFATLLAGLILAAALPAAGPLGAQDAPKPPEVVADEFQRGFQSMAWAGLVQRIHPEGLEFIRLAVDILVDVDDTGYVLETLLGGTPAEAYATLPDDEIVRRVLGGVQREAPGLLSSLVSRRSEILGVVTEGEQRHVVYRIVQLVAGAEPRMEVMTLRRHDGAWRVAEADDIQVLHTALRGIPIPRDPSRLPPGPSP